MRNSKFGLRAFGLALMAALGLMAFTAVAAQAENLSDGGKEGKFLVNGAAPTAGTTFSVTQEGTGTLLVPTRVDILCTGGTVTGEFKNATEALGGAEFTNCTAWSPVTELGASHVTQLKCTVNNPQGKVNSVVVEKAKALPKKHNNEPYILLEEDGADFTTVLLEGPECPVTKTNLITGSVVGQIDKNDTLEPLILFSHTIQKLFQTSTTLGDHLKFGALEAYIDGTGHAKGTGANAGKTLGVC